MKASTKLAAAVMDLESAAETFVENLWQLALRKEAAIDEMVALLAQRVPEQEGFARAIGEELTKRAVEAGHDALIKRGAPVEAGAFEKGLTISGRPVKVINGAARIFVDYGGIIEKHRRVCRLMDSYMGAVDATMSARRHVSVAKGRAYAKPMAGRS